MIEVVGGGPVSRAVGESEQDGCRQKQKREVGKRLAILLKVGNLLRLRVGQLNCGIDDVGFSGAFCDLEHGSRVEVCGISPATTMAYHQRKRKGMKKGPCGP